MQGTKFRIHNLLLKAMADRSGICLCAGTLCMMMLAACFPTMVHAAWFGSQWQNRKQITIDSAQDANQNDPATFYTLVGQKTAPVLLTVTTTSDAVNGDTLSVSNLIGNDGGDGISLREAIHAANNTVGADTIYFDITTPLIGGAHTIQVGTLGDGNNGPLPDLTDAVVIDGTTDPDFSLTPIIELDGTLAGSGVSSDGLRISAGGVVIRGLVVNRFGDAGIQVMGSGGSTIETCFIGTDVTGNLDRGNAASGIVIDSPLNTIGGASALARNVISGNDNGLLLLIGATNNVIQGNYVGTNQSGTAAIANTFDGVHIQDGAIDNTVGGSGANAGNLISGNGDDGVDLSDNGGVGTTGNVVQGNLIGTNASGTGSVPNMDDGVVIHLGASNNTIGGITPSARNIISGNGNDGVLIDDLLTTSNTVQGNYIGTDLGGGSAIPNGDDGVHLATNGNTVIGNVISGNVDYGIDVEGNGNTVRANLIGTSAAGTAAIANDQGLLLRGSNNSIGGTTAIARNIISGNLDDGLEINPSGTGNVVLGNYIGTDINGTFAIGNGDDGVDIAGVQNTIGGLIPGSRNIVSGNATDGIEIAEPTASGNVVQGNFIGVDVTGVIALGNADDGIQINQGAVADTIGGTDPAARNIISGNGGRGLDIRGVGTTGNVVRGNYIGTDSTGALPLANGLEGIQIIDATNTVVGGIAPGAGNQIAHNLSAGVLVANAASTGNAILANSIHSNAGRGIDLVGGTENSFGVTANDAGDADGGPNALQNFPVLSSAQTDGVGSVTVDGSLNAEPNASFRIEFFANALADTSQNGEGERYLGFTNAATDSTGNTTFNAILSGLVAAGEFVTVTATDPAGNTSEFASNVVATFLNTTPTIAVAMADTTVDEDNPPLNNYRDLNNVFSDAEEGSALTFSIESNSLPSVVTATIDAADSTLDFTFGSDQNGSAIIIVRATDSGSLFVEDTLTVTVTPVNDPPVVVNAIPDTVLAVDSSPIDDYRKLVDVFSDIEDGTTLTFSVESNSNPTLLTVTLAADSTLDLAVTPATSGVATVVVRATDSGTAFVEDTLTVTVDTGIFVTANPIGNFSIRPGAPPRSMYSLTISNLSATPDTVFAIDFTNTSTGLGTPSQLDTNFTPLTLSGQQGSTVLPGSAPGVRSGSVNAGTLRFDSLEVALPPSTAVTLTVSGGARLTARDGDVCDFVINAPADVTFGSAVPLAAQWPLDSPGSFRINGMVAAQLSLAPVTNATLSSGSNRNVVLQVGIPSNGYEVDILNRIDVINAGTAVNGTDISLVEAWVDDGDDSFNETMDALLGVFLFTGSRWEITGLAVGVPLSGAVIFVTADVAETASEGQTIRLSLPTLPDVAIGMNSGNDGPLDVAVVNPTVQTITSSDRVVLTGQSISPAVAKPGDRDVLMLDLVASNNYDVAKQVTRLTVHNASASSGAATQADLDGEIKAVQLRIDANDNGTLDDLLTDPVVGSASFFAGEATFTGLSWDLPAITSRHAFITVDVSNTLARDSDSLRVAVTAIWDIDFSDPTSVLASWPLDSDNHVLVDGMLASQITRNDITAATLAPNDGPALALDLVLPGNGYADDVLTSFEVTNLGTATDNDLADMRLWRDGGDGQFSAGGGDDVEIGPLVWTAGTWRSTTLSQPLPSGGTRVFVGLTVSSAPTDSSSVRLVVPLNGIIVASANDGPIDTTVESGQSLILSTAPLLATLSVDPIASTIGAPVNVRMIVRNVGGEQIDTITPSALGVSGMATAALQTGPTPASFDLAIAAVDTFTWVYTSVSAGDVAWNGSSQGTGAVSSLLRSTLNATSNSHQVFEEATNVDMFAIESMPFLIDRNQTGVTPLALTFTAPGNQNTSNVRIRELRLRLEDGSGSGIVPSELLSRISVSEGSTVYLNKTLLETNGDEIDLTFATPAVVPATDPVTLSLTMDMLPSTIVPEFRVTIVDSTWITADDVISGAPVFITIQQTQFPVASGLGRIVDAPTEISVTGLAAGAQRVGQSQNDVNLLTMRLDNPGVDGVTTDVAVSAFGITVVDTNGVAVANPNQIFSRIRTRGTFGTIFSDDPWMTGDTLMLALSPTADVTVNVARDLFIVGDIAIGAPLGTFRLRLADAADFDARDSNTGTPLPANYQSATIDGGATTIEALADSVFVNGTPLFVNSTTIGQPDVPALIVHMRHNAISGVGRVQVNDITVRCRNELRNPVIPSTFVSRIAVYQDTVEVGVLSSIPTSGDLMMVPLSAILLEPGDSVDLDIRFDVSATAPQSIVELIVDGSDIGATDANTTTPSIVAAQTGAILPLSSGLTQLLPPPTELQAGLESEMPAALVAGEQDVHVAKITLKNTAVSGAGPITIDHVTIRAADRAFNSMSLGSSATRVNVMLASVVAGQSDTLGIDSTTAYVPLSPSIVLQPQETRQIEVRLDCRQSISVDGLRVGIDRSDIGVVQPASALLQIQIEPETGQTFPMWTDAGGFNAQNLKDSFSNFPNPFAAGGESTTFVYYLHTNAKVSLRIFSGRGVSVTQLLTSASRSAGLYQDTLWNGRNGRGNAVVNGVYIAELIVEYEDGKSERLLRKVAVVR